MEGEEFIPVEPVRVLRSFIFEECVDADGRRFIRRANDGMSAHDLIVHLESVKLDLLLQLNTELAKRTKRTIITRTIKEATE